MNTFDPFTACLYCEALVETFERGPRGGASQNMTCRACGARYNLAIPSAEVAALIGDGPLFLEVLSPPVPRDAARVTT